MKEKMPVIFLGHGSPMIALENNLITQNLAELGRTLPKPKGILAISAHWYLKKLCVQSDPLPRQVYDMQGFPEALYQVKYPAKGSIELTRRVLELLERAETNDSWGIDHGSWSVLHHLFPGAPYPVVQLSVDALSSPEELMEIGRALRPLRQEGWLILGSGNIVHNLLQARWDKKDR